MFFNNKKSANFYLYIVAIYRIRFFKERKIEYIEVYLRSVLIWKISAYDSLEGNNNTLNSWANLKK